MARFACRSVWLADAIDEDIGGRFTPFSVLVGQDARDGDDDHHHRHDSKKKNV